MAGDTARTSPAASARRDAILDAAARVFLRYGFKKTSMDDLARAAGLSRQGLYLHFETKEAIFGATTLRIVAQSRARHRAALDRDDLDVEGRLLGAFESIHGDAVEGGHGEHLDELLEAAASLVGPRVHELETELVAAVAAILTRAGVVARYRGAGVSARDLAEHLYSTSCGLKSSARTRAVYRARMRLALKIVVKAPLPSKLTIG